VRFKTILYLFFIMLFIISISYNVICTRQLFDVGRDKDRIVELNKQYRETVKSANNRIGELEAIKQADQRTIDRLTANQRRSEITIRELTKLSEQRQNIIDQLTKGVVSDSEDLSRLREIIENLPKAK
jgi:cell division septum initiation protein DivIVA